MKLQGVVSSLPILLKEDCGPFLHCTVAVALHTDRARKNVHNISGIQLINAGMF